MKTIIKFLLREKYLLLSLLLALVATLPLFHQGLIPTHDGEYHLIRFYEFDKTLRSAALYPRWAPDLFFGYGIPLLTYVYPLPNYIASLFHVFGMSFLDSVKFNMVLASLVGSIFFYLFAKKFWGDMGGMVSSIFYTFSPYHFVDIYVRGSVGEVWAIGVFPGFLWAYTLFVETKKPVFAVLSALFLALTIFSHNILGLMFFFFAVSYVVFLLLNKERKMYLYSLAILLLALGISAVFWLPALLETNFVLGLQVYDIIHNFPDISQLLFPSWGTEFFGSTSGNEMSVQIGLMNLLVLFTSIPLLFIFNKQKKQNIARFLLFFIIWFFLSVFLMLYASYPLWKIIPLIHYFQFPWRFLSVTILVCSLLAGGIATFKKGKIIAWIFAILAVASTISYTTPAYYMVRSDQYYVSRSNFIDGTNSVGNIFNTIWATGKTKKAEALFILDNNQAILSMKRQTPTNFSAVITTNKKIKQVVSVSYFPSWQILVDNKKVETRSQNGLLAFDLKPGKHNIVIVLHETLLETLSGIISSLSILSLFFLLRKRLV